MIKIVPLKLKDNLSEIRDQEHYRDAARHQHWSQSFEWHSHKRESHHEEVIGKRSKPYIDIDTDEDSSEGKFFHPRDEPQGKGSGFFLENLDSILRDKKEDAIANKDSQATEEGKKQRIGTSARKGDHRGEKGKTSHSREPAKNS